jgi:hypothetical protein
MLQMLMCTQLVHSDEDLKLRGHYFYYLFIKSNHLFV